MAIKYSCDNCGKDTQEIVKNKEEYGLEFCNACLKSYQAEKAEIDARLEKEKAVALSKVDRKFGIEKEGLLSKVKASIA